MKYKIHIEWAHEPNLMRVTLHRRFMLLFIFELWLVEESRVCSIDSAFDWVCSYCDSYKIPPINITDFTKNFEG